jgi:hypothetical protein
MEQTLNGSWAPEDFARLPLKPPPSPWGSFVRRQAWLLTHIGFGSDCTRCQIICDSGVCVYALPSLVLVHTEPDTGLGIRFPSLVMDGVGPLKGQRLPFAGRFGGGFSCLSGDGWCCDLLPLGPTRHAVFLKANVTPFDLSADILSNPYSKIFEGDPVIASGFCACDNHLLIATSKEFMVSTRKTNA